MRSRGINVLYADNSDAHKMDVHESNVLKLQGGSLNLELIWSFFHRAIACLLRTSVPLGAEGVTPKCGLY